MSLMDEGHVRANSKAVLRPMPDDAPVMRMVLPERFLAVGVSGGDGGILEVFGVALGLGSVRG